MERRFDLIVFDWDGTLMDSTAHIAASLRDACIDLGLQPPSPQDAEWIIGMGLQPGLQRVLPELDPAEYPRLAEAYRRHFLAGDHALPLFPGVAELLEALAHAGNLLAVATGKTRKGLERALDQSGLRAHFHASCCADESLAKPDPAMLYQVMDRVGVLPTRALMIGDTVHDLGMAARAGVAAIGVSYGAHSGHELRSCTPLGVVDSPAELRDWLQGAGQLGPLTGGGRHARSVLVTADAPARLPLGRSADLLDGGCGLVFEAAPGVAGFVVRFEGRVRAWVNRCPHQGSPLDWEPGQFFDASGRRLVCATHGAQFDPASGRCVSGPCRGACLQPLAVEECDGQLFLHTGR